MIVCDNLVKIYKVAELEVVALQGLDLTVNKGELLGVIGASGSGKSSLLNILGGLDRPSAGRVWVDQKDLLKMSSSDLDVYRRTTVGFVWQQGARNLIPYLNVEENIVLPMTLAGQTGKSRYKRAHELLDMVNLPNRLHHRLSELSGGEQQRVAIAVAMANYPSLLLADEPTGELDSAASLRIYQMFRDFNTQYKITTLIVSHDPLIANHVDRVISIRDGKLSTETVRQKNNQSSEKDLLAGASNHPSRKETEIKPGIQSHLFEELTVLDSAGRLQIPKDYLKKFNMRSRVKLEITEKGILIIPAGAENITSSTEEIVDQIVKTNANKNILSVISRISRRHNR
jgi:ABC-type lipoprotein export system ATPase subunit/bifunctional DNA-binding transcriptional regulator/antitoxin component of YhaV-PrlF toxin-antitoxin module